MMFQVGDWVRIVDSTPAWEGRAGRVVGVLPQQGYVVKIGPMLIPFSLHEVSFNYP